MVRSVPHGVLTQSKRAGLVIDIVEKKVWRAGSMGKKVNWDAVDPEPHAVVLFPHNDGTINMPVVDLEVINENR